MAFSSAAGIASLWSDLSSDMISQQLKGLKSYIVTTDDPPAALPLRDIVTLFNDLTVP
jgi:hypothetical protein